LIVKLPFGKPQVGCADVNEDVKLLQS